MQWSKGVVYLYHVIISASSRDTCAVFALSLCRERGAAAARQVWSMASNLEKDEDFIMVSGFTDAIQRVGTDSERINLIHK